MAANHEVPKGPEPQGDKHIAKGHQTDVPSARDEAFAAMDRQSSHGAQAFAKPTDVKESLPAAVSQAVKAFTGIDFTRDDQTKISDAINRSAPKALEAVKALAGGSKLEAVTKLSELYASAADSTGQRIGNITQRIEDVKAAMAKAEEEQRRSQ